MSKKKLNVGMVGYGFMGRTHSNAFRQAGVFFDLPYQPVLKTICGRSQEKTNAFATQWGYESAETDWRKLIERKDIDALLKAGGDIDAACEGWHLTFWYPTQSR